MEGTLKHLIAGIALLVTCIASGQTPQPARWSGIATTFKNNAPHTAKVCYDGTVYALHWNTQQHSLQAFPREGDAFQKVFLDKLIKGHQPFITLTLVGDKPCVVYSSWEKGAASVKIRMQAYTAELLEHGAPIEVGEIAVDPKMYSGARISMDALRSPDGSKTLLLHSKLLADGTKQTSYWVFDQDRNLLWQAAHRIPMRNYKQPDRSWLTNSGTVLLRTYGVELQATGLSNSAAAKSTKGLQPSKTWYLVQGDSFGKLQAAESDPRLRHALPVTIGDKMYMTAVETHGRGALATAQWHVFRLLDDHSVEALASGTPNSEPGSFRTDVDHSVFHVDGSIHMAIPRTRGLHLIKLTPDHRSELWAKDLPWHHTEFAAVKGHAISVDLLNRDQAYDAVENRPWNQAPKTNNHFLIPVATVVDAKGKVQVHLITELEHTIVRFGEDSMDRFLEECGCVIVDNYRNSSDAMGLLRIELLQPEE